MDLPISKYFYSLLGPTTKIIYIYIYIDIYIYIYIYKVMKPTISDQFTYIYIYIYIYTLILSIAHMKISHNRFSSFQCPIYRLNAVISSNYFILISSIQDLNHFFSLILKNIYYFIQNVSKIRSYACGIQINSINIFNPQNCRFLFKKDWFCTHYSSKSNTLNIHGNTD